jgi:hypothetical protein
MSQPKIHAGMIVRSRDGEPLGRVISVDDEGFVLERRVVVTREHRMRFAEVHAMDEHGVVLTQEHASPRHHLEATDLVEVFWSARRARDEQKPLELRASPETVVSQRVATTKHAQAYPIQVERGTVRSPRYVPMSEEPTHHEGSAGAESSEATTRDAASEERPRRDTHPSPTRRSWNHGVRLPRAEQVMHYAAHPLQAASELLELLRGEKPGTRH